MENKMSRTVEKAERLTLYTVPLKGMTVFPAMQLSIDFSDKETVELCERAYESGEKLFFVSRRDISAPNVTPDMLFSVGTVVSVRQLLTLPDGSSRVMIEGESRAKVLSYIMKDDTGQIIADVLAKLVYSDADMSLQLRAGMNMLNNMLAECSKYLPKLSSEVLAAAKNIEAPGMLADFVAAHVITSPENKQTLLETFDPEKRINDLLEMLTEELAMLEIEFDIHRKVRARMEQNQREFYLREQYKVLQNELDMQGDADAEIDEYYDKLDELKLPKELDEKIVKEIRRLSKLPFGSAESSVIKSWLDACLEFPWKKMTKDRIDIEAASKVLEKDHDGLEKVKQRILEFLAVKQLTPDIKNQILCLVGPPGTGKTSIVASIARAMKRKYVRVSLGGVRDEADIRGHRKTYIGAMPGRIITALTNAGVRNPIILLDEIDKMTRDAHGDPSSALLEVLDSEQNKAFRDHFMELPVDLSECIFIATANTLETVPTPLIDRMEIIELKIYTRHEKLSIAKNHLLAKQLKRHGLNKRMVRMTDGAIYELIDFYTREAGVRNLEREIANICRKAAKQIIENGDDRRIDITEDNIKDYLGRRKIKPDRIADDDEVGVVNGLAYTELGGDILKIEASAVPGTGKIELTGSLGDVMKESARAAISYIRAHADTLNIDADFYKNKDVHIHVPEGAVPKDGPSAGVSIATALTSELSGVKIRRDIAMTGEITLRGNVIPIGGLKEKTMAAYKAGVHTVLIPADNMDDLEDIDPTVREKLEFVPCKKLDDVLSRALVTDNAPLA